MIGHWTLNTGLYKKSKSGFTLIELLVAMAILAILSTIGFGTFQSTRIKAADSKKKSDLNAVAKSLEAYVNDHRSYPLSNAAGEIVCQGTTTACSWGDPFIDAQNTIYTATLPYDDTGSYYRYESDGTTYTIYALLQNENDLSIEPGLTAVCDDDNIPCNYRVKSSNNL